MARKNMAHINIMLIIGIVICSANEEFQKTIVEEHYTTFYRIASNKMGECIKDCEIRHEKDQEKKKNCILECIKVECMRRYPNDKNKRIACIDEIYSSISKK
ncbi:hypothetical protein AAHE18_02G069400 [Arachis hypogaea]